MSIIKMMIVSLKKEIINEKTYKAAVSKYSKLNRKVNRFDYNWLQFAVKVTENTFWKL
jgi:virulence-associated protein VapD